MPSFCLLSIFKELVCKASLLICGLSLFNFSFNRLQLYDLVECKIQGDGNCQVGVGSNFLICDL